MSPWRIVSVFWGSLIFSPAIWRAVPRLLPQHTYPLRRFSLGLTSAPSIDLKADHCSVTPLFSLVPFLTVFKSVTSCRLKSLFWKSQWVVLHKADIEHSADRGSVWRHLQTHHHLPGEQFISSKSLSKSLWVSCRNRRTSFYIMLPTHYVL